MNRFKINFQQLINDLLPSFLRRSGQVYWLFSCSKALRNIHDKFISWGQNRKNDLKWNGQTIVLEHFLRNRYSDNRIRIENLYKDTSGAFVGSDGDASWHIGVEGESSSFVGTSYSVETDNFKVYVPIGLIYDPDEMRKQIDRYKLYATKFSIIEE
jgi:hypothetical protein